MSRTGDGNDMVEAELHWHGELDNSIKVSETGRSMDVKFLPLSKIEYERHGIRSVTVRMPRWLAEDRRIDYEEIE